MQTAMDQIRKQHSSVAAVLNCVWNWCGKWTGWLLMCCPEQKSTGGKVIWRTASRVEETWRQTFLWAQWRWQTHICSFWASLLYCELKEWKLCHRCLIRLRCSLHQTMFYLQNPFVPTEEMLESAQRLLVEVDEIQGGKKYSEPFDWMAACWMISLPCTQFSCRV